MRRTAGQRAGLERAEVIRAAVALADAQGLAHLSMRRLGQSLGVEAMSLYHHVPNKSTLLDAMVENVFAELEPPSAPRWRTALAEYAQRKRVVLSRHPWALQVLDSRTTPGPATLAHHDATLGYLRGQGFSIAGAGHVYALLDSYVYGFVLQEQQIPFDAASSAEFVEALTAEGQGSGLPHLAEYAQAMVIDAGRSFGDEFADGLDLILDGLVRWRRPD